MGMRAGEKSPESFFKQHFTDQRRFLVVHLSCIVYMKFLQVLSPFQVPCAVHVVRFPWDFPAADMLAARSQLQGFGGVRCKFIELPAHAHGVQQFLGIGFAFGILVAIHYRLMPVGHLD